jgi:hypothetical protein
VLERNEEVGDVLDGMVGFEHVVVESSDMENL